MLYNHSGVQPFAGGLVLHPNQHLRAVFDVGGQLVDGAVGVAGDSGIQDASLLISDVTVRFVAQLAGPTAVDLMTVPTSHASATSTPNPIKMQRQSETRVGESRLQHAIPGGAAGEARCRSPRLPAPSRSGAHRPVGTYLSGPTSQTALFGKRWRTAILRRPVRRAKATLPRPNETRRRR